ncbi:AraC family transcriptional regulator [Azorhizobium oxalatiphilum]|uniref:AraC family transcriptional regulator n=1 Tax=Azorhizobium oxalatiphilum TaxID=980631 RepID=A0A917BVQ6_9HYPH|nr:AraC family transcriptional regulator [Azorhizobium oxalatiphilum]
MWREADLPDGLEILRASCFDHRYPAHFHDEFVFAAFARGAQRHRIARFEGVAEAGTLMVIPPGEVHTGEAVERSRGWDYCAFYPSARFVEAIADEVLGGSGPVDFQGEVLRHDPELARHLLEASAAIGASGDVLTRQCAAYAAFGAVIARYGERPSGRRRAEAADTAMGQAIAFLEAHHGEPIGVNAVAETVGLSPYHFMRSFRAKTGLSVHRYLTQIRLNHAKALLLRGESAAEVALGAGFFDQSHLINQFRAQFGVTPGAFVAASR